MCPSHLCPAWGLRRRATTTCIWGQPGRVQDNEGRPLYPGLILMIPSVGPGLTSALRRCTAPPSLALCQERVPGIGLGQPPPPPTPGLAGGGLSRPMLHRPPAAPWCPRSESTALHFKAFSSPRGCLGPVLGGSIQSHLYRAHLSHTPGLQPTQTSRLSLAYQRPPQLACTPVPRSLAALAFHGAAFSVFSL